MDGYTEAVHGISRHVVAAITPNELGAFELVWAACEPWLQEVADTPPDEWDLRSPAKAGTLAPALTEADGGFGLVTARAMIAVAGALMEVAGGDEWSRSDVREILLKNLGRVDIPWLDENERDDVMHAVAVLVDLEVERLRAATRGDAGAVSRALEAEYVVATGSGESLPLDATQLSEWRLESDGRFHLHLDTTRFLLLIGGDIVEPGRRPLRALATLLEHGGEVASYEALDRAVRCKTTRPRSARGRVQQWAVELRNAHGELADGIQTVHDAGYRWQGDAAWCVIRFSATPLDPGPTSDGA